jgi:hypothetical protein
MARWDEDKLLISAISTVNPQLGYYALHLVAVDGDQADELPVEDERQLGAAVAGIGVDILRRAGKRREPPTESVGAPA